VEGFEFCSGCDPELGVQVESGSSNRKALVHGRWRARPRPLALAAAGSRGGGPGALRMPSVLAVSLTRRSNFGFGQAAEL